MSLAGNLRTMDLPEILQWISVGRKTGTLHLERRSIQKQIVFRDGIIFTSWSNDPRESLGQFLIRNRRVTEEQLFKALISQEDQGRLIGSILVSEGRITEEQLCEALITKAEETIYDLFLWPEGRFEFKDGEFPDDVLIHVDMDVRSVVMEGIRRVDEWKRIREVFPSFNLSFETMEGVAPPIDLTERVVFDLASQGKTLAQIALELRRSEFETASVLLSLYNQNTLRLGSINEEPKREELIGQIKDLLALAYEKLMERRFEAALEAYEQVLAIDRLNQHAKKGLIAVIEARNHERRLRGVPLNRIPVLTMDLQALTHENFDPLEGFVLSRVNGEWDVQSILKLCPIAEEDALLIFSRLLERKVIALR